MTAGAKGIRAGKAFVELFADDSRLVRGLRSAQRRLRAFGSVVSSMGRRLAMASVVTAAPIAIATKIFSSFSDQMAKVKAVTGASDAAFNNLTDRAKELGRTTSFTASQVAGAMVELGRAGFEPTAILNSIEGVLDLARATDTELPRAAEIAGAALRGFSLDSAEAGRVADVLTATANSSSQGLEDIGEALKVVAPIAVEAGESLEDTAAALGVLANNGIKGSLAGNSVARAYKNLSTSNAQKLLKSVGVEAVDSSGNLRKLADIAWWNGPQRQWDMATFNEYAAGCGIVIDEETDPPTINIDNLALAGPGLAPVGECGLTVLPGCGIVVGANVSVDNTALAGEGLVPSLTGCAVDVNPGCGIRVVNDQVKFEPLDVVGAGLSKVGDCGIDVLYACGLFINNNNELEVDADQLAGPGLGVFSQFGDCVLGITAGCGLVFSDATKDAILEVDLRGFDGCGLNAIQMTPGNDCWGLEVDAAEISGPGLTVFSQYGSCVIGVTTGCGLVLSDATKDAVLQIDLRGFDGPGLSAWQDPTSQCWGLQVDCQWIADNCVPELVLGCGLFENPVGEITVAPDDLAGQGLVAGGVACELNVALGCGLQFDISDQVEVDAAALAGNGLAPGTGCQLDVQIGCGLEIISDVVQVKASDLAGSGLVAEGSCGLAVNPGCGLQIVADAVAVNPAALAGHGLAPGVNCELDVQLGCGLQFDVSDQVALDTADLESNDIGPTGVGCSLQTKGFTGDKQVVVAIECDSYDPYACPMALIETWHFENGLLKSIT